VSSASQDYLLNLAGLRSRCKNPPPCHCAKTGQTQPELLPQLRKIDTPAACNAIEVVQGKRGFNLFARGTMIASAPAEGATVGYPVNAKIAALAPSTEDPAIIRAHQAGFDFEAFELAWQAFEKART
jgi:hypothetical protein